MSLTAVLPLFRSRLDALGYKEWDDVFNIENIPSTILNNSYHLEVSPVSGAGISHRVQNASMSVTLRVFLKGYRDIKTARDEAILSADGILCDIVASGTRLGTSVKNIIFDGYSLLPLDDSNDNAIIIEMNFTTFVAYAI